MTVSTTLSEQLAAITGSDQVLVGEAGSALYTDVYRQLETPLAVVRPSEVEQLQDIVRLCAREGIAVNIRGGGASYTDGYLADSPNQLLIDLSQLNRIVEINEEDAYVTVEAGTTWETLKQALDERGLRTPFWGPFSGMIATVGGSMSQNTISHGSGAHGISAQSALSMDVVMADGALLRTGSASATDSPFLRYFGPDLTGLFTGDCGSLGIKARITLPLLKQRPAHRNVSFAFPDFGSMHKSMRLIAQERLEDTHFSLDGALSQGQIARQDNAGDTLRIALSILNSSPSWWEGFKQLASAGLSARRIIGKSAYMTHYIVEGIDDSEVKSRLHRIRQLVTGLGTEIPATAPSVVRGMPFAPFYNTLGPNGERWVPLHGILPHSRVPGFHTALVDLFHSREAEMKRLGIWHGGMFATVGSSGFLYELALYWPDEITDYHRAVVPADYLAQLPVYESNAEARAYVHELKQALTDLYVSHGAVNFQLGKAYPYRERLQAPALDLIRNIKQHLDPGHSLAAGNLGLLED
ncbi:FAD-binding oxidoreductase [Parahaliea maris]|uniref:FAD-binding oxidoreductase n=1 Tax=Parahaliea maris TaxID=2716870 RepID=A0A5C8ZWN6_9GAMM|nr:FAD-binding oxidoreductase [Parahaliea maris]TXS92022.1 FAD-binding oxidoreductase [Parahaliea maris]